MSGVPPHSEEAELHVLGGVLIDNATIADMGVTIESADFYTSRHQLIWQGIEAVRVAGQEANVLTVWEWGKANHHDVSAEFLQYLVFTVPGGRYVPSHARVVRDKARLRAAARIAGNVHEDVMSGVVEAAAPYIETFADDVRKLAQDTACNQFNRKPLKDMLADEFEALDARVANPVDVSGYSTGYKDLDDVTLGIEQGDAWIIAARPNIGKSTLGMNICAHLARSGKASAFFSTEMPEKMLRQRLIASEARVPLGDIRTGRIKKRYMQWPGDPWSRMSRFLEDVRSWPLHLLDRPGVRPVDVAAECRDIQQSGPLDVVVVDYIQKMRPDRERKSRETEVSETMGALKEMAVRLGIGLIVCSQFNREGAKANRQPQLHDLRESGAIEQDADLVLALHPPSGKPDDPEVKGIILKGRNCGLGVVHFHKHGPIVRFDSATRGF